MRVTLPSCLSALRTVSAAQLRAMYDAVAAVLNGNLTEDNFAPRARIAKANKAAPRSWFVLEGQLYHPFAGDGGYGNPAAAGSGPSVLRWAAPALAPSVRRGVTKLTHWTAILGGTNGTSIATGTVNLRHTVKATGVTATVDTFAIPNLSETGKLFTRAIAELTIAAGDTLEVQVTGPVTFNGGGTRILGLAASLWLRTDHLP